MAEQRDSQAEITGDFERLGAGEARSILTAAPLGGGKTVTASALVASAAAAAQQSEQCKGASIQ
jgi:superfamily II DNA or RNA helicase